MQVAKSGIGEILAMVRALETIDCVFCVDKNMA